MQWSKLLPFIVGALVGVAPSLVASQTQVPNRAVVIGTSQLLDGKGQVLRDRQIVVQDGKIVSVRPWAGPVDYDLRGLTVMPGWIDAHVHITWIFGRDGKNAGTSGTTPEDSYKAASNAWATLMAGFTTVQSVGAPNDIPLRDEGLDVFVEQTTVTSINGAHAVRRIQSRDENHDGKRQKSDQDFCPDFEVCLPRDPSRPSLPDAPADIRDKQRRR